MSLKTIRFFVPGTPATAGSKRAFVNKSTGKAAIVDTCKEGPSWRESVRAAALASDEGILLIDYPTELDVVFCFMRPKGHFRTGSKAGQLKQSAPWWHSRKPDITKLLRAVEDALTGVIWRDDALIVKQHAIKRYHDKPGAFITIKPANTIENGEGS